MTILNLRNVIFDTLKLRKNDLIILNAKVKFFESQIELLEKMSETKVNELEQEEQIILLTF